VIGTHSPYTRSSGGIPAAAVIDVERSGGMPFRCRRASGVRTVGMRSATRVGKRLLAF